MMFTARSTETQRVCGVGGAHCNGRVAPVPSISGRPSRTGPSNPAEVKV